MNPEALEHLQRVDTVLGQVIRRFGPCTLSPRRRRSPFESLVRAVANQQLNGKAAETILGRFQRLFDGIPFPAPRDVGRVTDDQLRACGFSRAKVAAIRDIAEKSESGVIPSSREIARLADDEIVERLTEVRGVGPWTVQMLLVFQLGRPDVLPAADFGIRSGFRRVFGLGELPQPAEILRHGERWRPHRTTAAWYLWRAMEMK